MHFHPKPADLKPFDVGNNQPEAKYGLPLKIRYCARCVISNQRPNSAVEFRHTKATEKATIAFDDDGICDACRITEQKVTTIDWNERERHLKDLCDRFRSRNGSHDCVVPGSGGKDSFFASHVLKYKYGMNPLTVTWAPHIYTEWGWSNFQAWIHSGVDNYLHTPNGRVHRLLTRLAVENLLHPFQPFILGQKQAGPKFSIWSKIPLVFYGENEAEYGNPRLSASVAEQSWNYFSTQSDDDIFLGGTPISELRRNYGLVTADLSPYMPANPDQLKEVGTEVHYLGYYLKWHPQSCYYYAVEHGGFQASPERTPGTYSKYNSIDDKVDDFHYYTTFVKFGIGRATYDAAQEVRSGDITRDEGIALVRRFDGEFPERFAEEVFRYLSIGQKEFPQASQMFEQPIMSREYFERLCDQFRSPHLWQRVDGQWKLRRAVFSDLL